MGLCRQAFSVSCGGWGVIFPPLGALGINNVAFLSPFSARITYIIWQLIRMFTSLSQVKYLVHTRLWFTKKNATFVWIVSEVFWHFRAPLLVLAYLIVWNTSIHGGWGGGGGGGGDLKGAWLLLAFWLFPAILLRYIFCLEITEITLEWGMVNLQNRWFCLSNFLFSFPSIMIKAYTPGIFWVNVGINALTLPMLRLLSSKAKWR